MKKTVKINIGGVIFNIDEDAFEVLKEYLSEINSHFSRQEEGREIIADIEARIAELFHGRITGKKEVINMADVKEVIGIMGDPETFIREDEANGGGARVTYTVGGRRRLYRDPDNSVLGGVASGLGEYFDIDRVWIRLAFVLLAIIPYGFGVLLYIILWIVVPSARTSAQKLEMRGEKVTVRNIERSVKEEYERVKENIKHIPDSEAYRRTRSGLGDFFRLIGQVIVGIFKVVLVLVGVVFVLTGLSLLLGMVSVVFINFEWLPGSMEGFRNFSLHEFFGLFADPENLTLLLVCLFFVIAIPIFGLIYGGIKLIFRIRVNDRILGLSLFILWFICAVCLASVTIIETRDFREGGSVTEKALMESFDHGTLYIEVKKSQELEDYSNEQRFFDDEFPFIYQMVDKKIYGRVDLDVMVAEGETLELETRRYARGYSNRIARENALDAEFLYEMKDSVLLVNPYFSLREGRYWRGHEVDLNVYLPEGKRIYISKDALKFLSYIDNTEDAWRSGLVDKYWVMTKEGLAPAEK